VKLTKSKLKQIIKEELTQVFKEGEGNPMGPPSPSVSLVSLWQDLNVLLKNWTDREHQYYKDLYNLMEDYSTSPDRPTRLPHEEEGQTDSPGTEIDWHSTLPEKYK